MRWHQEEREAGHVGAAAFGSSHSPATIIHAVLSQRLNSNLYLTAKQWDPFTFYPKNSFPEYWAATYNSKMQNRAFVGWAPPAP